MAEYLTIKDQGKCKKKKKIEKKRIEKKNCALNVFIFYRHDFPFKLPTIKSALFLH